MFRGLSVHHIVPIEEDYSLRLDNDNLITLCSLCHSIAETGGIERRYLRSLAVSPPISRVSG